MEKVLLTFIAASGLCAVSSRVERQYHFVYEPMKWTEAQSYCRERYTDLATIDNLEDVETLNTMADSSKLMNYSYVAWIGLFDDVNSWRWSLADKMFYKDGETEFRNWKLSEPDNYKSREHCAMFQHGTWLDNSCENSAPAVCFDVRGSNVTFVLTDKPMTWPEAQSYCRERYTDLASVRNMADNQKVNQLVLAGQSAWIGLFRDSWKWSDGRNSSFRYWRQDTGEPNGGKETCAVTDFQHSGYWEDWTCDWRKPFICYSPVTTKRVIKLRLQRKDSSLDLNDPAVMEEMLMQLQQRLKDHGVNEGVKLSWKKQADGKVFHEDQKETKERKTSPEKDEL